MGSPNPMPINRSYFSESVHHYKEHCLLFESHPALLTWLLVDASRLKEIQFAFAAFFGFFSVHEHYLRFCSCLDLVSVNYSLVGWVTCYQKTLLRNQDRSKNMLRISLLFVNKVQGSFS